MKFKGRLSRKQKEANDFEWYKHRADSIEALHNSGLTTEDGLSRDRKLQVNYDLFNNKIRIEDFEYVCKPFGDGVGELPANMVNRDIVSSKVKALLGMEYKRPFDWDVIATDPEAVSRKENMYYNLMRESVISQIVGPIEQEIMMSMQSQQPQNPEEAQAMQQQAQSQIDELTPDAVKKYMEREYKDEVEIMTYHLLQYLRRNLDVSRKFDKMFAHGLLSASEVAYVSILNGKPTFNVVNPKYFSCDLSQENDFIEDGEWANYNLYLTPSQISKMFGNSLTNKNLDDIYEYWSPGVLNLDDLDLFAEIENGNSDRKRGFIHVSHSVWKALRKIGFLKYIDSAGIEQEKLVDETYIINTDAGDISVDWEWIPEAYETWKIHVGKPIYINMRPIPTQFKDISKVHYCKLPYYGVIHDNLNSEPTSLMDRMKQYQYYYNIVLYKIELLISSDEGKKLLMNINAVPSTDGFNLKKWQYFFKSTPFAWFNPKEEGMEYNDVNTMAKVIDMSLASDIMKYIEFAEYLRRQVGISTGITEAIEGQIQAREAVRNVQQNMQQSSNIIEGYFQLHDYVKRNILTALIEVSKVAYSETEPVELSYMTDDMTSETFKLDPTLLDNSTLGVFISNSTRSEEIRQEIRGLAHAAMQNQRIELSEMIEVLKQDNILETQETLKLSEDKRREFENQAQEREIQAQAEADGRHKEMIALQHEMEKEKIILKEEERRKTEVQKSALMGMSFNPEVDLDNDGENDFLEIYKEGIDTEIKLSKQQLEKRKLALQERQIEHKINNDNEKLKLEKKKVNLKK